MNLYFKIYFRKSSLTQATKIFLTEPKSREHQDWKYIILSCLKKLNLFLKTCSQLLNYTSTVNYISIPEDEYVKYVTK